MNNLEISGIVHSHPHYAELSEGRVLRFTLKHIPKREETLYDRPFTLLNIEYKDPPDKWWHNPTLHIGAQVEVQGEVSLLNFVNKKKGVEDKTIKCTITELVLVRDKRAPPSDFPPNRPSSANHKRTL